MWWFHLVYVWLNIKWHSLVSWLQEKNSNSLCLVNIKWHSLVSWLQEKNGNLKTQDSEPPTPRSVMKMGVRWVELRIYLCGWWGRYPVVITLLLPMLLISTMVMCYPLVINFFVILSSTIGAKCSILMLILLCWSEILVYVFPKCLKRNWGSTCCLHLPFVFQYTCSASSERDF